MPQCKDYNKDWLKNVPSTLEEARALNMKPNKQRLRNYWAMIRDYNRLVSGSKGDKTYATPLQLKHK